MVLGIFDTYAEADDAFGELINMAYTSDDISLITKESTVSEIVSNNAAKGIAEGAAAGGVIGGIVGLLTGIGAITIPGVGALLIAGPILAALGLTGAVASTTAGALTGILAGGLLGILKELGIDELQARSIENKIKEGGIMLIIKLKNLVENEEEKVKKTLEKYKASNITTLELKK